MAEIKSYSDLEQSKKLAEILPLESADMCCFENQDGSCNYYGFPYTQANKAANPIPLWSLAALLGVLPYPSLHKTFAGYRCDSYDKEGKTCKLGENAYNPIDACYKMIIRLHELNLL